jgi:thiamine-monophosphate kinase
MGLDNIGEFEFIDKIKRGTIYRDSGVLKGIGDDCAVLKPSDGKAILITTDILVEDTHFIRELISPYKLGRKSLAVNISDIAAMGGTPREAVISAAVPKSLSLEYLETLYDGIKSMAQEFDVNIVGGDTSGSPDRLVINVALIGEAAEDEILYRSGARKGDTIFVTGAVGGSAAGLDALKNRRFDEKWQSLIEMHNNPIPHVVAGRLLSGLKLVHSLIDISDGLAADLGHICEESGVGAIIYENAVPVNETALEYIRSFDLNIEMITLFSGEDYVLLGTMPSATTVIAREALKSSGYAFYPIGEIVAGEEVSLKSINGAIRNISQAGFDHFKR